MSFKRSFTEPVPKAREAGFAEQGIDAYHGRARLAGRDTVTVGEAVLEGRHILLATGAKPMPPGIAGEEHLATSDDFLDLETLPRRIVLVRGGYHAFEFAHIVRRAGAAVVVLEQGSRFLSPFDPDLFGWLVGEAAKLVCGARSQTSPP